MDENLLKQLFHWPADRPLLKPRFDTSLPPEPKALPAAGAQFLDESGYPKPWDLELRLDDLGLTVSVEKGMGERAGNCGSWYAAPGAVTWAKRCEWG